MPHTNGPWIVEGHTVITKVGEYIVARLPTVYNDADREMVIGDGHLIAAAPELLESLKAVMKFWTESREEDMPAKMFDGAFRAIAKAEGK